MSAYPKPSRLPRDWGGPFVWDINSGGRLELFTRERIERVLDALRDVSRRVAANLDAWDERNSDREPQS